MTIKLAFANQKGGVGKSALILQTAYYAAQKKLKVLVIDMDGKGNLSTKIATRQQIEQLPKRFTCSVNLFDPNLEKITVLNCKYGIDLIPSRINDQQLYTQEKAPLNTIINPHNNLAIFAQNYDLVIIDCTSSLGNLFLAGIVAADKIIMPLQISSFVVDSLSGLFEVVEKLQKIGKKDLEIAGILINSFNARNKQQHQAIKKLREKLGNLMMETVIANRSTIDKATNQAKPIWKIRSGAARLASLELTEAIEEIFERTGVNNERN